MLTLFCCGNVAVTWIRLSLRLIHVNRSNLRWDCRTAEWSLSNRKNLKGDGPSRTTLNLESSQGQWSISVLMFSIKPTKTVFFLFYHIDYSISFFSFWSNIVISIMGLLGMIKLNGGWNGKFLFLCLVKHKKYKENGIVVSWLIQYQTKHKKYKENGICCFLIDSIPMLGKYK